MVLGETIRSSAACCAVIGFAETIGYLQSIKNRLGGRLVDADVLVVLLKSNRVLMSHVSVPEIEIK